MSLFSQIVQYAISGLTGGSIYAVIGICWSIVYIITKVLNFMTGELVMLGGMLAWAFFETGMGLVPATCLSVVIVILFAVFLEQTTIRPVRFPSEMTFMMMTIALASIIRGAVLLIWGTETRKLNPFLEIKPLEVAGAFVAPQILIVVAYLIVVTLGLALFFNYTLFGKALRASAINITGAKLIGININKFNIFCFALAGGIGALTGIITTPITYTGHDIGMLTGMKGLVAAIIGGWNIPGTVLAGIILGLLEGFIAGFISPGFKDAIALLIMVLFLIVKTYNVKQIVRSLSR